MKTRDIWHFFQAKPRVEIELSMVGDTFEELHQHDIVDIERENQQRLFKSVMPELKNAYAEKCRTDLAREKHQLQMEKVIHEFTEKFDEKHRHQAEIQCQKQIAQLKMTINQQLTIIEDRMNAIFKNKGDVTAFNVWKDYQRRAQSGSYDEIPLGNLERLLNPKHWLGMQFDLDALKNVFELAKKANEDIKHLTELDYKLMKKDFDGDLPARKEIDYQMLRR